MIPDAMMPRLMIPGAMLTGTRLLIGACMVSFWAGILPATAAQAEGGQQLVDALDAAWVRVLKTREFRKIVSAHGLEDVILNIADCLPNPDVTPFPEHPAGKLQRILDEERINVGVSSGGTLDEGATATRFHNMGEDVLAAVFAELSTQYGVGEIDINYVTIAPPFPITSTLNSGAIDIVGQVNALGGETENLRRRDSRRFTCTLTATRQILWLKKEGGPSWQTANDALNDPELKLCVGPLSNQLSKAYFDLPGQQVKTEYVQDLNICLARLLNGEIDAMVSPFTHERFFPARIDTTGDGKADTATAGQFRSIDTNIVAGTPLWVALD